MSAADRPWWASGCDRLAPDEDPLESHRRARRSGCAPTPDEHAEGAGKRTSTGDGTRTSTGDGTRTSTGDGTRTSTGDGTRTSTGDGTRAEPNPTIDTCGVCPICVGLRALGDVRPELVVHLAEAARHLALAVRTAVDAATEAGEAAATAGGGGRTRDDRLQRIDLDD